MNLLHSDYIREQIQGDIDEVFDNFNEFLTKKVGLPLHDGEKSFGDMDDVKHYLIHDILNVISYLYAYCSDEEKYDIVERCNIIFDMCKFYINFDVVSVIEYNCCINRVTQDNFEKKARILVNELKIVNAFAEWNQVEHEVRQFYAYELLRGLLCYIVMGDYRRRTIEVCSRKDKALFVIFDKLFRRYCNLRHTINQTLYVFPLQYFYTSMRYFEGVHYFYGACLPMIAGMTEDNTYIEQCIFRYSTEFGEYEDFEKFLLDQNLIDASEITLDDDKNEEVNDFDIDEWLQTTECDIDIDEWLEIEEDTLEVSIDMFDEVEEEQTIVTKSMKRYLEADEVSPYEHFSPIQDEEFYIGKLKRKLL